MNDEPVFLTVDDVLALHVDQIREFGGSPAEVHWYESHGIGRKEFKIKRLLGVLP